MVSRRRWPIRTHSLWLLISQTIDALHAGKLLFLHSSLYTTARNRCCSAGVDLRTYQDVLEALSQEIDAFVAGEPKWRARILPVI